MMLSSKLFLSFNLTPSKLSPFAESSSPLLKERGDRPSDNRGRDGVRLQKLKLEKTLKSIHETPNP
jgi:hypothetical protein